VAGLFDRRLLIFSGKGGAGKSTVAAAVAAARRGKRVLIVEIGDEERIPSIFRNAKKSGYAGGRVSMPRPGGIPSIWSMCLTAREALREFAVRSMKFELFYEAIFENRVMRLFTAAAPGLDELTIMGKIEFLHREAVAPARHARFDLMIFDAPATGHGLALFKVPLTAMSMVRMGPLYSKAERMWQLLSDPARTAFNIVTLPEDMSVNESLDLYAAAQAMGLPCGKVIVNGAYPDFFPNDRPALLRARERAGPPSDLTGRIARAALDAAVSSSSRRAVRALRGRFAAGRGTAARRDRAAHQPRGSRAFLDPLRDARRGRPVRRRRDRPAKRAAVGDDARHQTYVGRSGVALRAE
jgi:anion-transporting  ArsA/GET3 family ATPase